MVLLFEIVLIDFVMTKSDKKKRRLWIRLF